jgi:DNA-binding response OmpR family regulator
MDFSLKPRILLVEDDAVSRTFLTIAAEGLPADVDAVDSCSTALRSAALQSAQDNPHDLWLIDANLPDGSGAGLLASLRQAFPPKPALAHTASHDPADHAALLAAGFDEVLVKPLPMIALQAAICRSLGYEHARDGHVPDAQAGNADSTSVCATLPSWDDAAALLALKGEQSHVIALRSLFLDELAGQCNTIERAFADGDVARAMRTLHMLRASCGFVGAVRLAEAARVLEGDPRSQFALERLTSAARDLLGSQATTPS